jgi:hypothetical protein
MSDFHGDHCIDAPAAPAHQAELIMDRRRPGRIHDIIPTLIPLLRDPQVGLVAGNLEPIDRFQIAAAWAASAYSPAVWRSLSVREQSAAIYRELRELDAAHATRV